MVTSEQWRPVVGYEGRYEVSDHGRVRSVWFRNKQTDRRRSIPLIRRLSADDLGYKRVSLCQALHSRTRLVHQLVLEAFVGPVPTKYEAAHLDGNPSNNSLGNLRWVSRSENQLQRHWHGGWSNWRCAHPRRYFNDRHLENLQILRAMGASVRSLTNLYDCSMRTIYRAIKGYVPTDSERERRRAYGRIYRERVRSRATIKP